VCDYQQVTEMRTETYCEMVPYVTTVQVPVAISSCNYGCGNGFNGGCGSPCSN